MRIGNVRLITAIRSLPAGDKPSTEHIVRTFGTPVAVTTDEVNR